MPADRKDERLARTGRRWGMAVDPDFSWSDAPDDPHSLAHRRHPAREADDWGLAGDDAWVVERERSSARALAERDRARRARAARAARDGLAGDWGETYREEAYRWAGSLAVDDVAAGPFGDEQRSAYDWARDFDSRFGHAGAAQVHASRIEPDSAELAQAEPAHLVADVSAETRYVPAETPSNIWEQRPSATGQRRTVIITGHGAEYGLSSRRRGWEASLPIHERSGFKPDRLALWAVLLGIVLLLVATMSSHAAVLTTHLAR